MNLNKISDNLIREEYQRRFTLKVGAPIMSSHEAIDHLRQFISDPARESFIVVFLNGNNRLITTEAIFQGTLTSSAIYPREVVRKALENHAASLIISHNHPSENLKPSQDDITITNKLREACKTVDITVHDHVIITAQGYYSFADHGLL